jgi:hypothetical protein
MRLSGTQALFTCGRQGNIEPPTSIKRLFEMNLVPIRRPGWMRMGSGTIGDGFNQHVGNFIGAEIEVDQLLAAIVAGFWIDVLGPKGSCPVLRVQRRGSKGNAWHIFFFVE